MKTPFPRRGAAVDRLTDLTGFGANPGNLRARIYVPTGLRKGAPLVVVLHGCTQNAAGYDHGSGWSRVADEHGFALLFPEQQPGNNPNLCFNWFVPEHVRRGGGEALSIRQMVARMVELHGLDPARIFVTGLSAGGAMTAAMLACYPEVFAGGAVIAGLPFGTATSMPEAFQRMRGKDGRDAAALADLVRAAAPAAGSWPTLSVWHGDADATVNRDNARQLVEQWRELHRLPAAPSRTETVDGQQRSVWTGADGRELIEEFTIAGMGHGTPLGTTGADAVGNAGAHMLEAGISSTRHIARFWGIASGNASISRDVSTEVKPQPRTAERPRLVRETPSPAAPHGVQAVIENALRAAGLMR